MILSQAKRFMKEGANNELYTPKDAAKHIVNFIPKGIKTVWECTDFGGSEIANTLKKSGYNVISTHIKEGQDFLSYKPNFDFDCIITNPPFSLKKKFILKALFFKKPFAFLLPITSIEGELCRIFNKYNPRFQQIIPDYRYNFLTKKSGSHFKTVWLTFDFQLSNHWNFVFKNNENLKLEI